MTPLPLTVSARLRLDAVRRALRRTRPRSVLEVGAGVGGMAVWLAARYEYVGVEPDEASYGVAAARLARLGRGRMARGGVNSLGDLQEKRFDLLCAFEVLEHIEDEAAALAAWRARLGDGGRLLLSVPAHSARFGPSDRAVGHIRRYDRGPLVGLLEENGFDVESVEAWGLGLGSALGAVRNVLARMRRRQGSPPPATPSPAERTAGSGRYLQPGNCFFALLNAAVAAPFRLAQIPFRTTELGSGYVVLARARP